MNDIFKIQILSYQNTPPTPFANFWWSEARGITCDKPKLLSRLANEGIALPNQQVVYPSDGRAFFDALPFRFNGMNSAQPAVIVDQQAGEPL